DAKLRKQPIHGQTFRRGDFMCHPESSRSAGIHWRAFLGQSKNTAQNAQKGRQQGRRRVETGGVPSRVR
ncbi:MAG TPA: hypothetical protein VFV44_04730, partial [Nitrospiraceae bacterium]|nr:hypothetical protein [Nitrospiraceae bacterium]